MRRIILGVFISIVLGDTARAVSPDPTFAARVGEAIARAVAARMGPGAAARVEQLSITATPGTGPLEVTPAPDARTGRLSSYSLTTITPGGPRRLGSAMATVRVETDMLRATRALARGDTLIQDDVVAGRGDADGVVLKRLPIAAETLGARVKRAVEEGALLSSDVLSVPWSVRSGQQVRLRAVVDGIEAHGMAVATENGRIGTVIRVVNPDSRRTLVGRVVGPGEVEVMHGL